MMLSGKSSGLCTTTRLNDGQRVGMTVRLPASTSSCLSTPRCVIARAATDDDSELEQRLEKLRQAKGKRPSPTKPEKERKSSEPEAKPVYDFTNETLHWEGGPSNGDLALNLGLATTLVWLPLTLGAVGRSAFVRYRFTDKRFSVKTTAPWKNEQVDVAYQEVKDVVTVGRGVGAWGDMVVTLRNGDKVELLRLDKFKELKEYVLKRREELAPPPSSSSGRKAGASVTAAELMGEEDVATTKSKKGFA